MNIFFGKISQKFDPVQLREGYYTSDKDSSWFGQLNLGDYVYMIGGGKIQLWKAKEWIDKKGEQNERLNFEVIFDDTNLKVKDLVAFKYFKLDMNLVVKSTRSTASEKKAFFKLEYDPGLTEEIILNKTTYTILENFRSIKSFLPNQTTEDDSYNIQIQFESGKLKLLPIRNCDPEIVNRFKDNISFIGKGRPNKDKTLRIAKDIKNAGADLDFTINNFFDAFLCDYNAKIEESLDKEENFEPEISSNSTEKSKKMVLNQILYGPPGTGKTFNSINKALEIINEEEEKELNWKDRNAVKNLFNKRVDEGRIVFTTFHQSMSYEDFIEGIKPEEPEKEGDPVIYKIKYGILRNQCIEACFEIAQLRDNDVTEEVLDFSILYDKFVEDIEEKLIEGKTVQLEIKTGGRVLVDSISQQGNVIIKHQDGNRTYTVSKARLTKLQSAIKELDDVSNINDEFRSIIGGSNSSAYWSVLNAIRKEKTFIPKSTEKRKYTFEEKKEVVLSLSKSDFKNKDGKPFVLIIDEINRGNVSQIFGELITLIEEDKRLGKEEALEVTLPYSKDKFGIPANLFIIGTMNTADRSVEALDTALRRRFCFEEMPPLYDLDGLQNDIFGYKAFEILKTVNSRIEKLIDKDHAIGHSYLLNKDHDSIVDSFYKNIIPLLQEYFFGDYGKLGLVLGKGFVHLKEWDKGADAFADFEDNASNDFDNRNVYEIIDYRKVTNYNLKQNKDEVTMDFEKAIQVLMNKKFD